MTQTDKTPVPPVQDERVTYFGKHIPTYYCGSCRTEINRTYRFCPYCGKEVKWDDEPCGYCRIT